MTTKNKVRIHNDEIPNIYFIDGEVEACQLSIKSLSIDFSEKVSTRSTN